MHAVFSRYAQIWQSTNLSSSSPLQTVGNTSKDWIVAQTSSSSSHTCHCDDSSKVYFFQRGHRQLLKLPVGKSEVIILSTHTHFAERRLSQCFLSLGRVIFTEQEKQHFSTTGEPAEEIFFCMWIVRLCSVKKIYCEKIRQCSAHQQGFWPEKTKVTNGALQPAQAYSWACAGRSHTVCVSEWESSSTRNLLML